jgi:hypothetical protein
MRRYAGHGSRHVAGEAPGWHPDVANLTWAKGLHLAKADIRGLSTGAVTCFGGPEQRERYTGGVVRLRLPRNSCMWSCHASDS